MSGGRAGGGAGEGGRAAAGEWGLLVFARYPEPGRAKTRLIPALGAAGAAELHREMTAHTLRTADELGRRGAGRVAVTVCYCGADRGRMAATFGAGRAYREQGDGDLGARLRRAFDDAFARGCRRVLAIGTDCPAVDAALLASAFDALASADVVLGPAADGGYYLIGLRAAEPRLFENIAWGTESVLAETERAAARLSLSARRLRTLTDVDRPEDLPAWRSQMNGGGSRPNGQVPPPPQ